MENLAPTNEALALGVNVMHLEALLYALEVVEQHKCELPLVRQVANAEFQYDSLKELFRLLARDPTTE